MVIPATCTVRKDRMDRCPLRTEKDLRKEGRGSVDFRTTAEGILVAEWFDNKEGHIASNHYSVHPMTKVFRWDKKVNRRIQINCPALISAYNSGMGGGGWIDVTSCCLSTGKIKNLEFRPKTNKKNQNHSKKLVIQNNTHSSCIYKVLFLVAISLFILHLNYKFKNP